MTVDDLEKALAALPPDQFARFRDWFERFDIARFDLKIENEVQAGKLDRLAAEAIDSLRSSRTREI